MISLPTTLQEVQKMIIDQVQESIHLDYKDSRAIDRNPKAKLEIIKDVSAFANSDGGIIIYGVTEQDQLPISIDSGVDDSQYSREWLEQVITSNVSPRMDGLRIQAIPVSTGKSIYVLQIAKTFRGPHQCTLDGRYYKRYNFESKFMLDYEINDIRNRRSELLPLINVDVKFRGSFLVYLRVENIGSVVAEDVQFTLPAELDGWLKEHSPNLFLRGVKHFPPKRSLDFLYGSYPALVSEGSRDPFQFDIEVSYKHPSINQRITERFHIDLMDYFKSSDVKSDFQENIEKGVKHIEELKGELKKLNQYGQKLMNITGATGLDLSIQTLRNLKRIFRENGNPEKLRASGCSLEIFMEVLNVDAQTAFHIWQFYRNRNNRDISQIKGMTEDLQKRFLESFEVDPPTDAPE